MNTPKTALDHTHKVSYCFYKTPLGQAQIQVAFHDETLWVTQKDLVEIFGCTKSAISKHLSNIFDEGELDAATTVSKMETVVKRGFRGEVVEEVETYNLDVIISVGYRINSIQATLFRKWATQVLHEYTLKGFALDDDRLKQGRTLLGRDYFRELLERVRSIRTSERRIWQQITDIFAECSRDYDKNSPDARHFYALVQNKFHYAITGRTAAEKIYESADASLPNMGLTTWKYAPNGRILKSDTEIAKNYLSEKEIRKLERSVANFFDHVEGLIEDQTDFSMAEFAQSVDDFLTFKRYQILQGNGSISHQQAIDKAHDQYDAFNKGQSIQSDFDQLLSLQEQLAQYEARGSLRSP